MRAFMQRAEQPGLSTRCPPQKTPTLRFPTNCLCPQGPVQRICPQEGRGDVATSDLVPFYWGLPRKQGLCSQSTHYDILCC